jgi:hypothetical protein
MNTPSGYSQCTHQLKFEKGMQYQDANSVGAQSSICHDFQDLGPCPTTAKTIGGITLQAVNENMRMRKL